MVEECHSVGDLNVSNTFYRAVILPHSTRCLLQIAGCAPAYA